MTPLVAKAVSVIVPPDEDVAARPADDLLGGITEDPLRRVIPEDDPPVSSDDDRPVTRIGERLIEHSLTETRGSDGRPVALLDILAGDRDSPQAMIPEARGRAPSTGRVPP